MKLKSSDINNKKIKSPKFLVATRFRGGAQFALFDISVKKVLLNFVANKEVIIGVLTGSNIAIAKIPSKSINIYSKKAFPLNLSNLEKKQLIISDLQEINYKSGDQGLKDLFTVLDDSNISFEEKQKFVHKILREYLNLKTMSERALLIMCLIFFLYVLAINSPANFYIIIQNLVAAIKEDRIPKKLA